MKKLKQNLGYTLVLLFFLSSISNLFAQPGFETSLKANLVINGINDAAPGQDYLKTNLVIPGVSLAIGSKHAYHFGFKRKNHVTINTGMMYEYSSFTRFQVNEYNVNSRFKWKEQYRIQYLQLPLEVEYHFDRLSFSAGFIFSSILSLRIENKTCSTQSSQFCNYRTLKTINYNPNDNKDWSSPFKDRIDSRTNVQYTVGFHYQLDKHVTIGMAFKKFIFASYLHHTVFGGDYIDNVEYKYQTKAVDLSVLYRLSKL